MKILPTQMRIIPAVLRVPAKIPTISWFSFSSSFTSSSACRWNGEGWRARSVQVDHTRLGAKPCLHTSLVPLILAPNAVAWERRERGLQWHRDRDAGGEDAGR